MVETDRETHKLRQWHNILGAVNETVIQTTTYKHVLHKNID